MIPHLAIPQFHFFKTLSSSPSTSSISISASNAPRATQTSRDPAPFPAQMLKCFDAPRENNGPHPSSLVASRLVLGATWQRKVLATLFSNLFQQCETEPSKPGNFRDLAAPPSQWPPSIEAPRKPLRTLPGLNAIRSEAIPLSRFWWGARGPGANRPCACSHHHLFFLFLGVESDSR